MEVEEYVAICAPLKHMRRNRNPHARAMPSSVFGVTPDNVTDARLIGTNSRSAGAADKYIRSFWASYESPSIETLSAQSTVSGLVRNSLLTGRVACERHLDDWEQQHPSGEGQNSELRLNGVRRKYCLIQHFRPSPPASLAKRVSGTLPVELNAVSPRLRAARSPVSAAARNPLLFVSSRACSSADLRCHVNRTGRRR